MIPWILAVLALWFVQLFFAASFRTVLAPDAQTVTMDHMRGKDHVPKPSLMGGRAARAQTNMQESLLIFLPLAILLEMKGAPGLAVPGAIAFFVGRLLYVPAYLLAVFGLRTAMWAVATGGMAVMAWSLVGG